MRKLRKSFSRVSIVMMTLLSLSGEAFGQAANPLAQASLSEINAIGFRLYSNADRSNWGNAEIVAEIEGTENHLIAKLREANIPIVDTANMTEAPIFFVSVIGNVKDRKCIYHYWSDLRETVTLLRSRPAHSIAATWEGGHGIGSTTAEGGRDCWGIIAKKVEASVDHFIVQYREDNPL